MKREQIKTTVQNVSDRFFVLYPSFILFPR